MSGESFIIPERRRRTKNSSPTRVRPAYRMSKEEKKGGKKLRHGGFNFGGGGATQVEIYPSLD